jgi:putative NIF3 family GTP cyclohydrolase 1 type 2
MHRKKFIGLTGLAALGTAVSGSVIYDPLIREHPQENARLTAADVHNYLRSLCDVGEPSVDRIVIGDPGTFVKKIGTAWMGYMSICQQAVNDGVNVLIVHEPPFYNKDISYFEQENDLPGQTRKEYLEMVRKKARWIEEHGLVIIRSHDVMDIVPGFGMPYALGMALGFTGDDIIRRAPGYNVYRTGPAPAIGVAQHIADALKSAGQPGVGFCGDSDYMVRSVGIGAGCNSDPLSLSWLEPDMYVVVDDKIRNWIQTPFAEDSGRPLVMINHGTSEEYGMRLLQLHLADRYPSYETVHYRTGFTYDWITPR